MESINWEPVLWIGGIFLTIISGLLVWIGNMQRQAARVITIRMDKQDTRQDKQEERLAVHDKEIHDIALSNREILTVMKHKFNIK